MPLYNVIKVLPSPLTPTTQTQSIEISVTRKKAKPQVFIGVSSSSPVTCCPHIPQNLTVSCGYGLQCLQFLGLMGVHLETVSSQLDFSVYVDDTVPI